MCKKIYRVTIFGAGAALLLTFSSAALAAPPPYLESLATELRRDAVPIRNQAQRVARHLNDSPETSVTASGEAKWIDGKKGKQQVVVSVTKRSHTYVKPDQILGGSGYPTIEYLFDVSKDGSISFVTERNDATPKWKGEKELARLAVMQLIIDGRPNIEFSLTAKRSPLQLAGGRETDGYKVETIIFPSKLLRRSKNKFPLSFTFTGKNLKPHALITSCEKKPLTIYYANRRDTYIDGWQIDKNAPRFTRRSKFHNFKPAKSKTVW